MFKFIKNLFNTVKDFLLRSKKTEQKQHEAQVLAKYIIVVLLSKWNDDDLKLYRTELNKHTSSEYELKIQILNDYKYLFSHEEYMTMLTRINNRFKV